MLILGIIYVFITACTIFGNILVIVAIKTDRKLQTKFNIYVVNLAVTDLTVAVTAMSFYSIEQFLGYWPFGKVLCGIWIFNDYGMTFVSVFTVLVISADRFWAVTWPNHYKYNNTKKKCFISILSIWILMLVLWLPACIADRIRAATEDNDKVCIWEPSLNKEYVVVIATLGHHGSFLIILFCYVKVFYVLRKRSITSKKIRPQNITIVDVSVIEPTTHHTGVSSVSKQEDQESDSVDDKNNGPKPNNDKKNLNVKTPMTTGTAVVGLANNEENGNHVTKRERKAFLTLTCIIVGYTVCWFPFHIVFDISSVVPNAVSNTIFQITFWMTYLNSTINPILYNFSNPEFRVAFRNILCKQKR